MIFVLTFLIGLVAAFVIARFDPHEPPLMAEAFTTIYFMFWLIWLIDHFI